MGRPILEVRNLVKNYQILEREPGLKGAVKALFKRTYRQKEAVRGINLDIQAGERVGYIGFNGAGKSTTIKMLAGVLKPDGGSVTVDGRDPHRERIENAKRIGAVFGQRTQLFWDIPVQESFSLLKEIYQIEDAEYAETLQLFTRELELQPLLDIPVRQLSLGQKMRCELAASFLHRPRIVYLDEPTIGLDIDIKETIRAFIREISEEWGTTVILTTHDLQDIESVCDRVIVLDDGRIIYDDQIRTLKETFSNERTLEVTLEPHRLFVLPETLKNRVQLLESGADDMTILAFDQRQITSGQLIREIVSHNTIQDVSVVVPKMESLIRKIYRKGA
ncbi:ABC transporter ATP-binding protein [Exiguobacterium flavidum]|uniref:ABC transporter ATP-binding protein n=1 Tax=Exiguobacterium flavidum TaxID=2184695 RepID=UPI001E49D84A|nr:ATP-binding cassette domain-containing protein [Exiguobacterium flavidum]